jgi:hypothetical protein
MNHTTPYPEPVPRAGISKAILFILIGVILPLIALAFEAYIHLSAEIFFDPIPSIAHMFVIAMVPLSNALLLIALSRNSVRHINKLACFNAFAIGIALFYAVLYLPLTPFAPILILWLGLGFLPLAPLLSLLAAHWGRRLLKRMVEEQHVTPIPHVWRGMVLALVMMTAIELPNTITRVGLHMAATESPTSILSGIQLLRAVGSEKALLRFCYERSSTPTDLIGMLFSVAEPTTTEQARTVFYQVTSKPFNDQPAPVRRGYRDWQSAFDDNVGGKSVGRRVDGVTLTGSRIDGSVDAQAAAGYLEWTMVFKNDAPLQQEGRAQIALPPGAVVSRVTLWIDGEEREAAFGGRSQVRQAYQKVVSRNRDPVLVTTAGKDRIMFQLFPIPPHGGEMKIRIGMTTPMVLTDLRHAQLQLPALSERNFDLAPDFAHSVWIESKMPLSGTADLKEEHPNPQLFAVRGEVADSKLGRGDSTVKAQRDMAQQTAWAIDTKARDHSVIVQHFSEQAAWAPQRAALVVDGSASMHDIKTQIADALARLPANVQLGLVLAGDEPQASLKPGGQTAATATAQINQFAFKGGRDNLSALAMAWDWAAAKPNGAVIWIHGPQPVMLGSEEPLLQRIERRGNRVKIFELQAVAGPNRLLEKLDGLPTFEAVPRVGTAGDDLANLIQQWRPDAKQIAVTRNRVAANSDGLTQEMKTSDHLVRLWAADQVAQLAEARGNTQSTQHSAAVAMAQRYQLVTSVSGAVVLETKQQYQEAGLEPVAAGSVPTVPEPETWMLIMIVLGCLTWLYRHNYLARSCVNHA